MPAHTALSRFTSTHGSFEHGSSVCLEPLPGSEPHHPPQAQGHWLLHSMLASKHVALRLLSLMQSMFTNPFEVPAQTTTHFISWPGSGPPTCQLVQCEVLDTDYMQTSCTAGLGKIQMFILTPPGACTAVLLQLLALSSSLPPSSCFLVHVPFPSQWLMAKDHTSSCQHWYSPTQSSSWHHRPWVPTLPVSLQ